VRLGCGCFLVLLIGLGTLGATAWVSVKCLQTPDIARAEPAARTGLKIEHRGGARGSGMRSGHSTVELSAVEVSRLVAKQLAERLESAPPDVRIGLRPDDPVEIAFTVPLHRVLAESALAGFGGRLPARWLDRPVWLDMHASPRLETVGPGAGRRYLRLDLREFAVGRQRWPTLVARLLLEPGTLSALRWPLPDGVESVTIEKDRVLVRLAS
jgi:hypothetical protein